MVLRLERQRLVLGLGRRLVVEPFSVPPMCACMFAVTSDLICSDSVLGGQSATLEHKIPSDVVVDRPVHGGCDR